MRTVLSFLGGALAASLLIKIMVDRKCKKLEAAAGAPDKSGAAITATDTMQMPANPLAPPVVKSGFAGEDENFSDATGRRKRAGFKSGGKRRRRTQH